MKNLIKQILREQFRENLNMLGEELQPCSLNPVTGFKEQGCNSSPDIFRFSPNCSLNICLIKFFILC